jgi:hypothetical protein
MRYVAVRGVPSPPAVAETKVAGWLKPPGPVTTTSPSPSVEAWTPLASE